MTRIAVVTGGSRGIGYSTAGQLLDAGFEVVITGRNEVSLREAQGALSTRGSVTTLAFDASSAEATVRSLTPLQVDVLIANVGVGYSGSILKTSLDDWEMVLRNNVTSAFVAIQSVLSGMMERKWGRIVTVGSMASHLPIRSGVAYVASKHALLGITRAIALDVKGSRRHGQYGCASLRSNGHDQGECHENRGRQRPQIGCRRAEVGGTVNPQPPP